MKKLFKILALVVISIFVATGVMAIGGGGGMSPAKWKINGVLQPSTPNQDVEMVNLEVTGTLTSSGTMIGSVDLNGNEFILDADADTSITADTDDQIDFKIGNADDFQFTANLFSALSGSIFTSDDLDSTTATTLLLGKSTATKVEIADSGVETNIQGTLVIDDDLTITGDDLTMATNSIGALLVGDDTNFNPVVMSGDATIAADGTITVGTSATIKISCKEENTGNIVKGQPVYISGANAVGPKVGLADTDDSSKIRILGLAAEAITQDTTGCIITKGLLEGVDTLGANVVNPNGETWAVGALLYVDDTAGGLTHTKPTSGRIIKAAYSLKGSSDTDNLFVIARENDIYVAAASGENIKLRMGDDAGANYVNFKDYGNNIVGYVDSDGVIQTGANGFDGKLQIYSEQGGTDYTASLFANTAMTSAASFYLPADEPVGTYLLNMTSGGVIGFDESTYLTSSTGAVRALSNLDTVNINLSLVSDAANTDDLGTEAKYWKKLFLASELSFEGVTDNDYQTTFSVVDPTSDRAISFQNAAGIVAMDNNAVWDLEGTGLSISAGQLSAHVPIAISGEDYLSLSTQAITANAIDPDNLANTSFGDFSCNGTTCVSGATNTNLTTLSNVTTIGTISSGTWSSTDIGVAYGGTGRSEHTAYGVLCGGTTTTAAQQSIAALGTAGQVLTSAGAGALPAFETLSIAAGEYAAASIDGDDINSNIAGRSLTLTGASPDTLDIDAEIYTHTKCIYFEDPVAEDDFKSIFANKTANDWTLTELWAESDQTVTFMLQVDDDSPADIDNVDLAPAVGEAEDTDLNGDTTLAAGEEIDIDLVSVANTPTWVSICLTYTIND